MLGKENVPKTLDAWQNLKYNDIGKYEELKELYRNTNWQVESLKNHDKGSVHTVPFNAQPNSVFDNYGKDGTLLQRRYYGRTGKPRLDIDMTDHGNPKEHKVVPHIHDWTLLDESNWERYKFHDNKLEKWHEIANKDILKGSGGK